MRSSADAEHIHTELPPFALRSVETFADALRMRTVRNRVRHFLTRDRSHIGPLRQWLWWRRVYRPRARAATMKAWLVLELPAHRPAGYGLVQWDRGRWWVTGGLLPSFRGKGLGRRLFRFLTWDAAARSKATDGKGEVWLEVQAGNLPARRLYESLGYRLEGQVLVGRPQDTLVMVRRAGAGAIRPPAEPPRV